MIIDLIIYLPKNITINILTYVIFKVQYETIVIK